jgi:hypothetical protein
MLREEAVRLRHIQAQFRIVHELNLIEVIDAMLDDLDSGEVQNLIA